MSVDLNSKNSIDDVDKIVDEIGLFVSTCGAKKIIEHELVMTALDNISKNGFKNIYQKDTYYNIAERLVKEKIEKIINYSNDAERKLIYERLIAFCRIKFFSIQFSAHYQQAIAKESGIITDIKRGIDPLQRR